jgi:hypothetical protein
MASSTKGAEIEHSRKEFTGDEYVQVFLHYVDADGPNKDFVYDSKKKSLRTNIFSILTRLKITQFIINL